MQSSDPLFTNPALALAVGDDGYLAYDIRRHRLHRLNATASLILEMSDGTRDRDAIVAELSPILPESERARCGAWIDHALDERLLLAASDVTLPVPDADAFAEAASDLRDAGEVLAAFVCQEHATTLDPSVPAYWSRLGELGHITGHRERAREAYESYLELEPDDAEVEQIIVALRDEIPPLRAPDRCIEQLYARFAAGYESNMCDDLSYQAPTRLAEALDAHVPAVEPVDVLELGPGTGLAARVLRPRARVLVGVDLSPAMVEKARETGSYDELVVAEITGWLDGNARAFDLVAACDTLIYFGDLRQVLVPAARALTPGGWVAFTVERSAAPDFVLTDSGRYAHSADHIRAAARDAGLDVVSLNEGFLRYEYGEPVTGLVVVLRKA